MRLGTWYRSTWWHRWKPAGWLAGPLVALYLAIQFENRIAFWWKHRPRTQVVSSP